MEGTGTDELVTLRAPGAPAPRGAEERRMPAVAARELEAALRAATGAEVRFDAGSRALYATDASNYRHVPIGVVVPRTVEDVVRAVSVCHDFGAPIVSRGGGTSLAGQACNVAVVIDFSKHLHRVLEIDPRTRRARVQPGAILDRLRDQAERHRLTFGPDPSTHDRCTLGGMIGNDSCGVHSILAGRTSENVHELEILTYDGIRMRVGATPPDELERLCREDGRRGVIYRGLRDLRDRYEKHIREGYPAIPRRVSGYGLDALLPDHGFHVARALVGTEGTCVTVLEAAVDLVHSPPERSLLVLGFEDVFRAGDAVPELLGFDPIGMEGMDERLVTLLRRKRMHGEGVSKLPPGGAWLLVEFGGETPEESSSKARRAERAFHGQATGAARIDDRREAKELWETRESGLAATARVAGRADAWPGWEDSAVHPERLGGYLRDLRALFDRFGYDAALYGHFGQGCVHCRIDFDLHSAEGIERMRRFLEEAADLVVSHGGSLSGEHGDGQARGELLGRMYGPELLQAFREFKAIWDPQGRMNPGRVVDARPITADLRLGTDYHPRQPPTRFRFVDDEGSLARAALRCVGVGACRREKGGTMCPSFQVTREEMHSTRGRAHLLHEMLAGDVIGDGWAEEHVKEALDLCLACKGCKTQCPMQVDMATYKAEFLMHYHRRRLRPAAAWAFGFVDVWARLASIAPGAVNAAARAPLLARTGKRALGIARHRKVPQFASRTFREWFRGTEHANRGAPPVILWADTFNEYFRPETLRAAKRVLEAAGRFVLVPGARLCCGRPLYDFGFLGIAASRLRRILDYLRPWIRQGVPVVGLEPSCVSVFRDELVQLFPNDEDARRLSGQTRTLAELLAESPGPWRPPARSGAVLVHGHCHDKTVLGFDSEVSLLETTGLSVDVPDTGCCGMAGAFGYERDKYDVSMACAERELLPSTRRAHASGARIVTDGFSCREQIEQATDIPTLHLAQLLDPARLE